MASPTRQPTTSIVEAYNLACAFIDLDGLATDDELWALIQAFSPRLDIPLLKATPSDVRHAGLTTGTSAFLSTPSTMFEILHGLDARDGTAHARTYYELAVAIGHVVASIDTHTSSTELLGIERYRGMLLAGAAEPSHRPTPTTSAPRDRTRAASRADWSRPARSTSCWPSSTRSSGCRRSRTRSSSSRT